MLILSAALIQTRGMLILTISAGIIVLIGFIAVFIDDDGSYGFLVIIIALLMFIAGLLAELVNKS